MRDEYEPHEQKTQLPDTNAYAELIRQVDRALALTETLEKRLAPILAQPMSYTDDANAKRDRFPSALGEHVGRLTDFLDTLDEIIIRVDL